MESATLLCDPEMYFAVELQPINLRRLLKILELLTSSSLRLLEMLIKGR